MTPDAGRTAPPSLGRPGRPHTPSASPARVPSSTRRTGTTTRGDDVHTPDTRGLCDGPADGTFASDEFRPTRSRS